MIIQWLIDTLTWLPAIIVALTFHEYAHGKVAHWLGDNTPYYQGRLTLNPLPHIDWVGFFMLLFFKFGWAKPVQVNPLNFKQAGIKQGMMMVALAGPLMNLLLALAGMLVMRLTGYDPGTGFAVYSSSSVVLLVAPLVYINLILAVFNLIPLPPLDGSKILAGLLPDEGAAVIYSLEQYGPIILLLLIVTGAFSRVLGPLVNIMYHLLYTAVF